MSKKLGVEILRPTWFQLTRPFEPELDETRRMLAQDVVRVTPTPRTRGIG